MTLPSGFPGSRSRAREPKPDWNAVPPAARAALERKLGQKIVAAEIAWGGFSPGATFKIALADGSGRFVKSTNPQQTPAGNDMVLAEIECFERYPCIGSAGPAYLGHQEAGDWHWLILELIADATQPPPWTKAQLRNLFEALAAFYARARDAALPPDIADQGHAKLDELFPTDSGGWVEMQSDPGARRLFAGAFMDAAAAERWLDAVVPRMVPLQRARPVVGGPRSLIHLDLRSDNVLFRRDCGAVILDWSDVTWGPVAIDLLAFAPSCIGEGGATGPELAEAFAAALGAPLRDDDIAIGLAAIAGFFVGRVGRAPSPGLPRLPWVVRMQFWGAMRWAERAIGTPPLPEFAPLAG